jgi:signal transduction histidine kinase
MGLVDPLRLRQVVTNLISNAVKFSAQADRVHIDLESVGEEIWLSVKDYGIGMRKEELANIFEPHFRSARAKNRGIRGLGLGLFLAAEIVKRHGAKIEVISEYNRGSTFRLKFPTYKKLKN